MEVVATACNIAANAVLLRRTCTNARTPIPLLLVGLQIVGNGAWMIHARLIRDYYLFTTAGVSMTMQCVSWGLLFLSNGGRSGTNVVRQAVRQAVRTAVGSVMEGIVGRVVRRVVGREGGRDCGRDGGRDGGREEDFSKRLWTSPKIAGCDSDSHLLCLTPIDQ
jgi:hypothetical protein